MNKVNRIWMILAGMLILSCIAGPYAAAQNGKRGDQFVFGPPLRDGILFMYKYTERVKSWMLDKNGSTQDSSERILTYYISERQTADEVGGGARVIEANIDSMQLDYRSPAGNITFNTQKLSDVNNIELVRHQAVLVPSTLVSSVSRFTISPYGNFVRMESKGFNDIREQGQDPMLDDFTYKRIEQMITDDYLSTIFLPWRNAVPFGHTVEFNKEIPIAFIGTLDRIVFADSAVAMLRHGDEDSTKPILTFKAALSNPKTEWVTYEGRNDPVLLKGADAVVSGMFKLDRDGVVLSGTTIANGTALGSARGKEVNARFEHQTYVELVEMKAAPVNN